MRACFIHRGEIRRFSAEYEGDGSEITIFGFQGMGEVNYEKELNGETSFFEAAARLSKQGNNVVVCGCTTNACGHIRKSAVVAEKGKLLGVSDMLHVIDGGVSCGAALRVYDTQLGRMGVVVADDLKFPEVIKTLTDCGSDFLVCVYEKMLDQVPCVLLRAYAYCYGVPVLFCASGYSVVADVGGSVEFASPQSPFCVEVETQKQYHLVESRRRGLYTPSRERD
ncbi:MAG: hypothetical protein IJV85_05065 [Clostridia bacterium]|nr:hypothetical protein [Clostridia bacterium]